MNGAEMVISKFEDLARELGVTVVAPVSKPSGRGEEITIHFGAAYCTAVWWDHGSPFSLYLGRHIEIAGRRFISEFAVDEFEESAGRRVGDYPDLDVQIREQFLLLRRHGMAWLRGDFSQEPFISHKVLPDRENA